MAKDHDNLEDGVSRRHALGRMMWTGAGVLWAVSGGVSKWFDEDDGVQERAGRPASG